LIGARHAGERCAFAFRARSFLGFGLARRFALGGLNVDRIAPVPKQLARSVGRIASRASVSEPSVAWDRL
jgi:hypothetical protein